MFNQAYALVKVGREAEAMELLQQAKSKAAATSESRHKIIAPALDTVMVSPLMIHYCKQLISNSILVQWHLVVDLK